MICQFSLLKLNNKTKIYFKKMSANNTIIYILINKLLQCLQLRESYNVFSINYVFKKEKHVTLLIKTVYLTTKLEKSDIKTKPKIKT